MHASIPSAQRPRTRNAQVPCLANIPSSILALAASMQEAQGASYDDSNQTLFKREFHRKELELRERVGLSLWACKCEG